MKFKAKKIPAKHSFYQKFFGKNAPRAKSLGKPDKIVNYQPTRSQSEKYRAKMWENHF